MLCYMYVCIFMYGFPVFQDYWAQYIMLHNNYSSQNSTQGAVGKQYIFFILCLVQTLKGMYINFTKLYHKLCRNREYLFFLKGMSRLPTVCHDISRNRKTIVYSMSYAKKVLLICNIDLFFNISIIQKKLALPKLCRCIKKNLGFRVYSQGHYFCSTKLFF